MTVAQFRMVMATPGRWLFLGCLALLTSCANMGGENPVANGWENHRQQVAALTTWRTQGKMALRNNDTAESAALTWIQRGADSWLTLSGPFGAGATSLHSNGDQLTVNRADGVQTINISSEQAIIASTGWNLPVQSLPYWIKGIASPHSTPEKLQLTGDGSHLALLKQDGWTIQYSRYAPFDGVALPIRLTAENRDTHVKLVLRQWQRDPGGE